MTIHGRVGDGGVAESRGQANWSCRRLCGVEIGEMTKISDADLHRHPEEVNLRVCR